MATPIKTVVIKVRVGSNGVPYAEETCKRFKKEKTRIKWTLTGSPKHELVGISGLAKPPFTFVPPGATTDVVFENDNQNVKDYPNLYFYDIIVRETAKALLTTGKAIIRNDPGSP
jgi:hypothetical protein